MPATGCVALHDCLLTAIVVIGKDVPVAREPRIRVVPIADSPGRKLARVHARLQQGLGQLFQEAGHPITTGGWALLSQLWAEDRLTQLELGQRLEKDGPTTSRLVDALEQEGYVRRRMPDHDRRVREVGLTEKGRAARAPLTRMATDFLEDVFAEVSDSRLEAFVGTLDHLVLRLDALSRVRPERGQPRRRTPAR